VSVLKQSGYNAIDLKYLTDNQESYKEYAKTGYGLQESPITGNETTTMRAGVGKGMYFNWKKLQPYIDKAKRVKTVNNLVNLFDKGKFGVGTRGHSMAYVNGKLYDFASKGPSKSRINVNRFGN